MFQSQRRRIAVKPDVEYEATVQKSGNLGKSYIDGRCMEQVSMQVLL